MRAAYQTFEDEHLPQLKDEHPTLRLSQLKQLLKKQWAKSPDNPLNKAQQMVLQMNDSKANVSALPTDSDQDD
jgi:hypothetical protein